MGSVSASNPRIRKAEQVLKVDLAIIFARGHRRGGGAARYQEKAVGSGAQLVMGAA